MDKEPQLYEEQDFDDDIQSADIEDKTTQVGISQQSKMAITGVIAVVVIIVVYFMFFSGEDKKPDNPKKTENTSPLVKPRDEDGEIIVGHTAKPPSETLEPLISNIEPDYEEIVDDVPEIQIPELPPVADIKVDIPDQNVIPSVESDKLKTKPDGTPVSRLDELQLSEIDSIDTPATGEAPPPPKPKEYQSIMVKTGGNKNFSGYTGLVLNPSSAESVTAEQIEYPKRTIAQGKLIDAVLETAINTDFAGSVRAIVSRDVYSDFGKNILIPKGSRVIGSYSDVVENSQTRVLVNWDRLIRPDAVDIALDSPASDQFGRSGIAGDVDKKFLEIFNNAILLSLLTIGTSIALDEISDSDGITVEDDSDGDSTVSGNASDFAAADLIDTLSTTGETVLTGLLNTTPTITVPNGTRIKIFVNQDLIFPEVPGDNADGLIIVK